MNKMFVLIAVFFSHFSYAQLVSEYPPYLPEKLGDIPLNGGRCHSIAVHPADRNTIIISNQFGGLWKTTDGGNTWRHLNSLNAIFTNDICFGPDGNTVICTRSKDNAVDNGGGIWVSRDAGETWSRPATGRIPSFSGRTPVRGAAYGISYDPDSTGKIFVGTTSGIAISSDNGISWRHAMLESTSWVNWKDSLQNQVLSVLAYGLNKVYALTRTGVYKSDDGGINWTNIRTGDFTFGGSFKMIDVWKNPGVRDGAYGVFILQNYTTLLLYEDYYKRWSTITLPGGGSRGPFVRVSNAATDGYKSVWIGAGVKLLKITKRSLSSFRSGLLSTKDWLQLHRAEGIHDDSGFMGLDANGNIALYGSDGGIFRPVNLEGSRWTNASVRFSGMNSYQITDLGITNYLNASFGFRLPDFTALYFSTQDNGIWASYDGGANWPNSDCAEGFHIEVKNDGDFSDKSLQVAYGKIGCKPSERMFSGAFLENQRKVPTVNTSGVDLVDTLLGQAFLLGTSSYYRKRNPIGGNPEGYVSDNRGDNWRKRYEYSNISSRGVPHCGRLGPDGPTRVWIPFTANGDNNRDGSERIGLLLHLYPFNTGVSIMNSTNMRFLPDDGSLGIRATEFDWQAVFGINPDDYRHIIAPDIVNNVVKVSRDAGNTWVTDDVLTKLVTRNGSIKIYDDALSIQVTHISWDPYRNNRILVGTRETGVMLSEDGGATWRRIKNSPDILFATGFVFRPDNIAYACSYGRGLWKIDFNVFVSSPTEYYSCRDCVIYDPGFSPIPFRDFSDYSVVTVRGGQVTAIGYGKDQKPELYISEKAFYRAWMPENSEDGLLPIIRDKKTQDNYLDKLKGVCNDCAITGIIMKGNMIAGYITHAKEMPLENDDYYNYQNNNEKDVSEPNMPEEGAGFADNQPVLSIQTKVVTHFENFSTKLAIST